ncbi:MAG: phasin family protein, partial [Anderseniella sp.]|nr:phasin family protein [Anderseniella sp.]
MTASSDSRRTPTELPQATITHAMKYGAEAMRALTDCQGKYASFVSKRLTEDMAMPARLAECKSPMEVIEVWTDFYSKALEDYTAHARNMTALGQQALEDTVREAEVEAAEIAEATGAAIEKVTGVKAVSPLKPEGN